jgi:hypothetical protein
MNTVPPALEPEQATDAESATSCHAVQVTVPIVAAPICYIQLNKTHSFATLLGKMSLKFL